jgi:transposase
MAPGNRKQPKRGKASESQYTLLEFMADYPDDNACLTFLWNTRYNLGDDTAHCATCGEIRTFRRYEGKQQRQAWSCTACGDHLYPTAGTIYHKSSTGLHLWFYALYLMTSTRCGISAKQLERELGVTYKTAWRMFNKIRNQVMTQGEKRLTGHVEMDETYVGGKPRASDKAKFAGDPSGRQSAAIKWSADRKVPIFGMVQRQGNIAAYVVPKKPRASIAAHIDNQVERGSTIYTDDSRLYDRLAKAGWDHKVINHSAKTYASGDIHTQTIDGFWALVKNATSGVHHGVSRKWLQGYVSEYAWRWNHRDRERRMFDLLLERSACPVQ